jgi:hypothetical protein
MIRAFRRWQLRDDIAILEHAIAQERARHENFEKIIATLQWNVKRKRAALAELAATKPRRAQMMLAGLRRQK